jgi:hypothetical protein
LAALNAEVETTAHGGEFFAGQLFADFQIFDEHDSSPKG